MDKNFLKTAYHKIKMIRMFEDYVEKSAAEGTGPLMGLLHTHSGAEAWVSAVMLNLEPKDYVLSTYRNHAHSIARGINMGEFVAEISGKITGTCRGMAGNMHAVDQNLNMVAGFGIIGAGLPSACGTALASKMNKTDEVSAVFFGDGAIPQGATHESFNMAGVKKLPVLFCNDNNHIAMSTDPSNNLCDTTTANYMKAYNIPAVTVDGMDFFASYEATKKAVEYIRQGNGPYFIEFDNARYGGQWVGDPVNYKSAEQKEAELAKDPVKRFEKEVVEKGLLSEQELKEIEKAIEKEIEEAVKFAEESPLPQISDMYVNIYADSY